MLDVELTGLAFSVNINIGRGPESDKSFSHASQVIEVLIIVDSLPDGTGLFDTGDSVLDEPPAVIQHERGQADHNSRDEKASRDSVPADVGPETRPHEHENGETDREDVFLLVLKQKRFERIIH